ncbi:MAG: hypothetical protein RIE53_13815 [Rhodothermales bacterium]
MHEGYSPDFLEDPLDELMCEYVDGTMDPAVRAAFEEFLEANPELLEEAKCLCQTRDMLCSYGFRNTQSSQCQMRRRVVDEIGRKDRSEKVIADRLANIALVTSAVGLVLIFGMMVGLTNDAVPVVVGEQVASEEPETPVDSMVQPVDAHFGLSGGVPLEWRIDQSRTGLVAPISSLPVLSSSVHMTPSVSRARSGFQTASAAVSASASGSR